MTALWLRRLPHTALPFHAAAWASANESCNALLNETDPARRDAMTRAWKEHMTAQLNTTIITSSIVSSLVSSSFSWPCFSDASPETICLSLVKATWYSALALSVASVAAASQQLVALHRLSTHDDDLKILRAMLAGTKDAAGGSQPVAEAAVKRLSFLQAYLWQIPVMMLNGGLYLFFCGLCLVAYWDFTRHIHGASLGAAALAVL
ncbi:hypothetical protein ACHAQA_010025, partial [Verticillium albo-atrum]